MADRDRRLREDEVTPTASGKHRLVTVEIPVALVWAVTQMLDAFNDKNTGHVEAHFNGCGGNPKVVRKVNLTEPPGLAAAFGAEKVDG